MPMRIWSNRNSCSLLLGMQNGTTTLEGNWARSKLKLIPCDPAISLLGLLPNEWKFYFHAKTQIFLAGFIHNYQNLEATKMPFKRRMDKQTHPYSGILFSTKNKSAIKPWKDMGNLKNILLSERSQSEQDTQYDFVYIDILEKAKLQRWLKDW